MRTNYIPALLVTLTLAVPLWAAQHGYAGGGQHRGPGQGHAHSPRCVAKQPCGHHRPCGRSRHSGRSRRFANNQRFGHNKPSELNQRCGHKLRVQLPPYAMKLPCVRP